MVVPAGVPIELWDSGLAISAHAGDTLQTIATTYHVPLWTLTQLNKVSETAALTEGQRVVTPHSVGQKLPSSPAQNPVSSDATNETAGAIVQKGGAVISSHADIPGAGPTVPEP